MPPATEPATDPNRRPLKTRSWGVFQSLAAWLARRGVAPNAISLMSVVFGLAAGAAFMATGRVESDVAQRLLWLAAGAGIQLRLVANLLDGMVAVEGGKRTPVGELYNEAPDRVADALILLGAGYATGGDPRLGAAATIIAIFVAYVRALGTTVGVGQVFLGPMAKPHRMALLTAVCLFGVAAPNSWRSYELGGLGVMGWALAVVVVGGLVTAARRLREIARRMRARDA